MNSVQGLTFDFDAEDLPLLRMLRLKWYSIFEGLLSDFTLPLATYITNFPAFQASSRLAIVVVKKEVGSSSARGH